jgi:hypothetical protein
MIETAVVHIIDNISFEPDVSALVKRLRIKAGKEGEFLRLLEQGCGLAHPRALYLSAYITNRGDHWVEVEGVRFTSRVLRVNLDSAYRVFPYLATCGLELQQWAEGIDDMLLGYWAETIKEAAMVCAIEALHTDMETRYHLEKSSKMSPGSLPDWPIQEQRPLFDLLGGDQDQIGVRLTENMLMVPTKTVSGIRFPTEVAFENCQLCPREGCPGRRAVYDPQLFDSRYCLHNG